MGGAEGGEVAVVVAAAAAAADMRKVGRRLRFLASIQVAAVLYLVVLLTIFPGVNGHDPQYFGFDVIVLVQKRTVFFCVFTSKFDTY